MRPFSGGPRTTSGARRERKPRSRRVLLLALGLGAAAVVVGAFIVLAIYADSIAQRAAARIIPNISRQIGHTVKVSEVHARVLPTLQVELDRVSVLPNKPAEPDLFDADRLSARVKVLPLLWSLGRRIEVNEIRLDGPRVNLVRRDGGRWNYDDIPTNGGGQNQNEASRDVRVSVFRVRNGSVALYDNTLGAKKRWVGGGPRSIAPSPGGRAQTPAIAMDALDATVRGIGTGHPMDVRMSAAVASDKPNVRFEGTFTPPEKESGTGTGKEHGPGGAAGQGDFTITNARLDEFESILPARVGDIFKGGLVSFRGTVDRSLDGASRVQGDGSIRDLSAGGGKFDAEFDLSAKASAGSENATGPMQVDVTRLGLHGPDTDIGGRASLRSTGKVGAASSVDFDITGPKLNLDPFLAGSGAPPPSDANSSPTPVPSDVQQGLAGVTARGKIDIGSVRTGKLDLRDLKGQATLSRGILTLQRADAGLYGGTISLTGTRVDFTAAPPSWQLHQNLQGFDIEQAAQDLWGVRPLRGKASCELQLSGTGSEWNELRDTVSGTGNLSLADGTLGYNLADVFSKGLPGALQGLRLGQPAPQSDSHAANGTHIDKLAATFTVNRGWASLRSPLGLETPVGKVSLLGRVRLDGQLDLTGHTDLSPSFVSQVGNALPANSAIPMTVRGSVNDPQIALAVQPRDIGQGILNKLLH